MKKHLKTIFLALLIGASFGLGAQELFLPLSSTSKTAHKHYKEALKAANFLQLDKFWEHMEKAVAEDPNLMMAYFSMAAWDNFLGSGEKVEALTAKGLACKGEWNEAEQIVHQMLEASQQPDGVNWEAYSQKMVEAYPNVVEAYGWMTNFASTPEARLASANKAVELAPDYAPVYNMQGYALMALNRYGEAEAAFQKQIDLAPKEGNPYDSMGECLMNQGKYAKAEKHFRQAYETDNYFSGSWARAEVMAGMQVVEKETSSFMAGDYEGWASCWQHSPQVAFYYTSKEGIWKSEGWAAVSKNAKEMFADENSRPAEVKMKRAGLNWRHNEGMIFLHYTQSDNEGNTTKEMRVLQKNPDGGQWRIVLMNAIGTSSYKKEAKG